jgi:radical SAM protein
VTGSQIAENYRKSMAELLLKPNSRHHAKRDYSQTPLNIYWEVSQACALACRHCRAEAIPTPHPMELTLEEGCRFLCQIRDFGEPLPQLILTGGDPLQRADLFCLIDEARRLGISISITPAATPALTREVLVRLKEHHVEGLGLSLDGSLPESHDSIRGVAGTFERTLQAIRWAQELQIPLQVNTLVAEETVHEIPAVYDLLKGYSVTRWSLFFLISVGRGKVLQPLSPQEGEELMGWIFEISNSAPFVVATTEAPSFRRVAIERMRAGGLSGDQLKGGAGSRSFGIRDGHGIMFVSCTGDIYPAGFLPLVVGNVRKDRLADIYRNAPTFRALHDPKQFAGRCGFCEYNAVCGGSRARAYAATGDPLASDPFCDYEPHARKLEQARIGP